MGFGVILAWCGGWVREMGMDMKDVMGMKEADM